MISVRFQSKLATRIRTMEKAALTQLRICCLTTIAVEKKLVKNSVVTEYSYEILGSAVISSLEAEQTLQHVAWFAAVVLAPSIGLETGGKLWGTQGEGETQIRATQSPQLFLQWLWLWSSRHRLPCPGQAC